MRVVVDTSTESVLLADPDDFGRFHIEVTGGGGSDDVARALEAQRVGRLEGDHAFVEVDALRRLAAASRSPEWESKLEAMVAYARGKGWLAPEGDAIQAHIEGMGSG